tara:strand:+ start:59 stop:679 length:621 start_codon:yes stop_codon:yes gene_type:complete
MARPVYQYQIVRDNSNQRIGVKLPFNSDGAGKQYNANYASGSAGGGGVFVSSFSTREQAISNLINLILTEKGERYLQPNFGTNIRTVLFDNNTTQIRKKLKDSLAQDITYWLPYIKLRGISVTSSEDMHSLNIRLVVSITSVGANVVINILANENTLIASEVPLAPEEEALVQVDSFGGSTAFDLGLQGEINPTEVVGGGGGGGGY